MRISFNSIYPYIIIEVMDTDNRPLSSTMNHELIKPLMQQIRGMEHIEPIITFENNTQKRRENGVHCKHRKP